MAVCGHSWGKEGPTGPRWWKLVVLCGEIIPTWRVKIQKTGMYCVSSFIQMSLRSCTRYEAHKVRNGMGALPGVLGNMSTDRIWRAYSGSAPQRNDSSMKIYDRVISKFSAYADTWWEETSITCVKYALVAYVWQCQTYQSPCQQRGVSSDRNRLLKRQRDATIA